MRQPPLEERGMILFVVFVIDVLEHVKIKFFLLFHATSLQEFFETMYIVGRLKLKLLMK